MAILCYHTVDDRFRSRLSLTPAQFEEHCRWLAADRDVVDLATALELVDEHGRLPRGVVALTFDDGLEGVYRFAAPSLVRHGLPATVFLVADTLTGEHPHVDWVDDAPPGELRAVSPEQVREMAATGIAFGSHSSRHLDLPTLDPDACEVDLRRSRTVLEDLLDVEVPHVAYPRGRHDAMVRSAARRAGFRHGLALPEGPEPADPFAVARVGVYAHNALPTVRLKSRPAYVRVRTSRAWPMARGTLRVARSVAGAARRRDPAREEAPEARPAGSAPIAIVTSRFPKVSETFVLNQVLELRRRGVDAQLFPLQREDQPVRHPEAVAMTATATFTPFASPGVLASQLAHLRRAPGRYLATWWQVLRGTAGSRRFLLGALAFTPMAMHMARVMTQRGVRHVHCHFASHPTLVGLVVHRMTGIPFSFTAHGSDLHRDRRMLESKVAGAAFVVTISEYNRRVILDECRPELHDRVHVVHCGVDTSRFDAPAAPDRDGPLRVLCVGTLHEVKGQRHLVDAVASLTAAGVDVRCELVGDGPDRAMLESWARERGVADLVTLRGALPGADVVRAMADADVVVAPSVPSSDGRREGIPVVLMEAMAMRRPVVASRLSGIPELVEDGRSGLLVPPGDADAVAEALLRLARDARLRRELGLAGRRRVEAAFSLEGEVDRLLALVGTFHGDAQLLAASRRAAASTPDGRTDSSHSS